jgi:transcription antitermination factor NusG
MSIEKNQWYAVYTKPRCEKKVHGLLLERGFKAYCPLNRVSKQWSDRRKWVEEPLFTSYVFVRLMEEDLGRVRMINGVVNFVYWLGRPAVIPDREIQIIRNFLSEYKEVYAEPIPLQKDDEITVLSGLLMDMQAKVIKVVNNKVRVRIESIGYSLVAVLDKSNVTKCQRQVGASS